MFAALYLTAAAALFATQDTVHLVVAATTDVHGHATAWDYTRDAPFPGGLARAATAVDSLRRLYPDHVILVDAGDLIQGDPFADYFARVAPRDPNPIIDAMNLLRYDAATPGNHEFNYGLPAMRRALGGATFAYVSGNIYADDARMYPPYTVIRRGGVRIAIGGFTTPGVMVWDREHVAGKARVGRVMETAPAVLAGMRNAADFSLVLIHSGMGEASSYDTTGVGPENVAARLAAAPAPPDLVVVGHTHRQMTDSVVRGVHFIQPRPFAQSLAVAHVWLVRDGTRWRVARIRGDEVPLAVVEPDPRVERRLAGDQQAVRVYVQRPIGTATAAMSARYARTGPTSIITFVNAVQRERAHTQLSSTAAFNTGASFTAGDIRLADVAALYPYENTLVGIQISGAQLKEYLEYASRYYRVVDRQVTINDSVPGYNFDILLGADYTIDLRQPVGKRIVTLTVDGVPVTPTDSFTLALNSYRQSGGGGFRMLAGAPVVYNRGENIRDLLVDAIRRRARIDPGDFSQANWRLEPPPAERGARALFTPKGASRAELSVPALRILATTDLSGALAPDPTTAGVAALKTAMDSVAAACDCPSLRLDAGGHLGGTLLTDLEYGRPAVEAYNRLEIAATTAGPQDLAWPLDTLRQRMAESTTQWAMANVFASATGARPTWVHPYQEIPAGGLKVGVIGYLSPGRAALMTMPGRLDFEFRAGAAPLLPMLEELRGRGPDVIVLLAQAQDTCPTPGCRGALPEVVDGLAGAGLTLVVAGGGAGPARDTMMAGIPVVRPAPRGAGFAVVDLYRSEGGWRTRVAQVRVDPRTKPDTLLAGRVARYQRTADALAMDTVARLKLPAPRTPGPSALGNLVADAFRNALRTDVGVVPAGALGAGLGAGEVTYGDLIRVLPARLELINATMSGAELRTFLENAVGGEAPLVHVAGLTVRYDPHRQPGSRVRDVRLADGSELDDHRQYTVAVPGELAGSPIALPPGAVPGRTRVLDVDALALYLRRLPQPVEAPAAARFVLP